MLAIMALVCSRWYPPSSRSVSELHRVPRERGRAQPESEIQQPTKEAIVTGLQDPWVKERYSQRDGAMAQEKHPAEEAGLEKESGNVFHVGQLFPLGTALPSKRDS